MQYFRNYIYIFYDLSFYEKCFFINTYCLSVNYLYIFLLLRKPNTTADWRPLPKDKSLPWVQLHISNPNKIYVEEINENLANRAFWESLGFEENEKLLNIKDDR